MCRNIKMLYNFEPPVSDDEVKWLMREIAPGGSYAASSGNSLTSYL
jgi:hypothetical protein